MHNKTDYRENHYMEYLHVTLFTLALSAIFMILFAKLLFVTVGGLLISSHLISLNFYCCFSHLFFFNTMNLFVVVGFCLVWLLVFHTYL